jgi:hypothetical protein
MTAFHTNWTKPFSLRNPNSPYFIEDYDLLTTILSALEWRKHNGGIKMITDSVGIEYYRRMGVTHIWDLGIYASLDALDGEAIYPLSFWAAGKIFALKQQTAPCVMIDTDLIVWKSLAFDTSGAALAVAHREDLNSTIYPEKPFFNMDANYRFPPEWDWTILPCNTALLYIASEEFKDYYTSESIRFMRNLRETKDITAEMVFAEQRLLAMCAAAREIDINTLLNIEDIETQNSFTHIWGFKGELSGNQEKRRELCLDCINRIISDFPDETAVLGQIENLKPYWELIHGN